MQAFKMKIAKKKQEYSLVHEYYQIVNTIFTVERDDSGPSGSGGIDSLFVDSLVFGILLWLRIFGTILGKDKTFEACSPLLCIL